VAVERGYPNEAGQPFSRVVLTLGPDATLTRDDLVRRLWEGDPCIAVAEIGTDAIGLSPQTILDGEIPIVLSAVRAALGER
jgi:hypothetical protein